MQQMRPTHSKALPPNSLDTPADSSDYHYIYHIYTDIKSFEVEGGPKASEFGQRGLGAQFYVGAAGDILTLMQEEYPKKVNKCSLRPGAGKRGDWASTVSALIC